MVFFLNRKFYVQTIREKIEKNDLLQNVSIQKSIFLKILYLIPMLFQKQKNFLISTIIFKSNGNVMTI